MSSARLNLLVLHAADIEMSRRFYEAIGLIFVREQHGQGPAHYACDTGDLVVELYPKRSTDAQSGRAALSLGFWVSSIEAVLQRVRALADPGAAVACEPVGDHPLRLVDPDGHVVFVTARADG
jgi:lactoylglutathione lyase